MFTTLTPNSGAWLGDVRRTPGGAPAPPVGLACRTDAESRLPSPGGLSPRLAAGGTWAGGLLDVSPDSSTPPLLPAPLLTPISTRPHPPPPVRTGGDPAASFARTPVWAGSSAGLEAKGSSHARITGSQAWDELHDLPEASSVRGDPAQRPRGARGHSVCVALGRPPLRLRGEPGDAGLASAARALSSAPSCVSRSAPRPWRPRPGSRADGLQAAGPQGTRPGRRDWQAWYPGPRCSLSMEAGSPVGTDMGPDPERRQVRAPACRHRAGVRFMGSLNLTPFMARRSSREAGLPGLSSRDGEQGCRPPAGRGGTGPRAGMGRRGPGFTPGARSALPLVPATWRTFDHCREGRSKVRSHCDGGDQPRALRHPLFPSPAFSA